MRMRAHADVWPCTRSCGLERRDSALHSSESNGLNSDGKDTTLTLDKRRQAQERLLKMDMGVGQYD